ncbi:MAG: efflux RND transporter periplasmic adaptor subunit [Rhodopirellula sp. JB055]|uniref:efflux RND transporter periplasmic adaptor subunit n=1 Tax=Rhodopirellula sp. JB055 TaxID=3342846 RepID=UPI00370B4D54
MKSAVPWGTWGKRLLVIPPIVLAIVAYAWLVKHSPPLTEQPEDEVSRMLETMIVQRMDVRPKVSGYGTAQYARSWRAVTQVEGRIKKIHPDLRPGSMIQEGEVLLEIDDSDYRSQVEQLEATIDQQNAEIEQLEQSIENEQKSLALETEVLAVLQREFDREETLLTRQAGSSASLDSKRRELLAQQKAVQDLKNSIALIGPQIKALQAARRQSEVQKTQALRDIGRTKITAPFPMRVGEVQLEVGQYVNVSENLFEGYNIADVEVEAQLALDDIHRLLVAESAGKEIDEQFTQEAFRQAFAFDAVVNVPGSEETSSYHGNFLRVREIVDHQTKMVGFVVGVQNLPPSQQEQPQPPLLEGAFCDVDVFGNTLADQIVIPRRAVRNGSVYLVDDESRLGMQKVELMFTQDDYAIVGSGLAGGERLVIANPSPAIIGMLVDPIDAVEETQKLITSVAADAPELPSGPSSSQTQRVP